MKILVSIISSSKHLESRLAFIEKTWLSSVENYVIISDLDIPERNMIKVCEDSSYESNVIKNFESFKILYEKFTDFDWYINLDDDTYLNLENLKELLIEHSTEEIFVLGKINYGTLPSEPDLNYCSGGAGYVFNRKTLSLLKKIDISYNRSRFADANIGMFCRDQNIEIRNNDLFHPREPSYHGDSHTEIKNSISYHYIFGNEFFNIYNIQKNKL